MGWRQSSQLVKIKCGKIKDHLLCIQTSWGDLDESNSLLYIKLVSLVYWRDW
jgi:hypothetical protein